MSCTHDVSAHLDEDTGNSILSCSKSIFMGSANSLLPPIYDVTRTVRCGSRERIAEVLNVWPYGSPRHPISTLMEREMLLLLLFFPPSRKGSVHASKYRASAAATRKTRYSCRCKVTPSRELVIRQLDEEMTHTRHCGHAG